MNSTVYLSTVFKNKRTILHTSYNTPPFKIADITENRNAGKLELMLMNSSPGMLDKDQYNLNIDAGPYCSLELYTQSFQRIFTMKNGARQNMNINLDQGASFMYMPHPVVPHRLADFTGRCRIELSEGCTLVWAEIISCGRKLNDEYFAFSRYHNITEISLNGQLIVKENMMLVPSMTNLGSIGQWEGYTHQATFIFIKQGIDAIALIDALRVKFKDQHSVSYGISRLQTHGIIVRILGNSGEQLFDLMKKIASYSSGIKKIGEEHRSEEKQVTFVV